MIISNKILAVTDQKRICSIKTRNPVFDTHVLKATKTFTDVNIFA